jgi:hypothetical protein
VKRLVNEVDSLKPKESKPNKSTESDKQIPTPKVSSSNRRIKPAPAGEPQGFTRWYQAFPRHEAREKALKAWRQINPDAALVETITAATSRYAAANVDTEKKYILHPATWLNDKRWQDELEGESSATGPPPFEDLGNDMVKAEGITMTRKTYERRYARSA